jgi:hypothetical protein
MHCSPLAMKVKKRGKGHLVISSERYKFISHFFGFFFNIFSRCRNRAITVVILCWFYQVLFI